MADLKTISGLKPRVVEERDGFLNIKTRNRNGPILILTGLGLLFLVGYGIASLAVGERTLECAHDEGESQCTYELAEVDPLHVWVRRKHHTFSVDEIRETRASDEVVTINFEPDADVPTSYSLHTPIPQLNLGFYGKPHEIRSRVNAFINSPNERTVDIAQGWKQRLDIVGVTAFGLALALISFGLATAGYSIRISRPEGTLKLRRTKFLIPTTSTYDIDDIARVEIETNVAEKLSTMSYRPVLRLRNETVVPIQSSYELKLQNVEILRDRLHDKLDLS